MRAMTMNLIFVLVLLTFLNLSSQVKAISFEKRAKPVLETSSEEKKGESLLELETAMLTKDDEDQYEKFKNFVAGLESNDSPVAKKILENLKIRKEMKKARIEARKKRRAARGGKKADRKLSAKKQALRDQLEAKDNEPQKSDKDILKSLFLKFLEYKKQMGKNYITDDKNLDRFANFLKRTEKLDDINSDPDKTFTVKLNRYSDMAKADLKKRVFTLIDLDMSKVKKAHLKKPVLDDIFDLFTETSSTTETETQEASLGPPINWVTRGKVTAVADQGDCGCCWAFGATGVLEGFYAIKKGINAVKFSQQQLIDCTASSGYPGSCDGGHPYFALDYILNNQKTISLYDQYTYAGKKGATCLAKDFLSSVNQNNVLSTFISQIVVNTNISQLALYQLLQNGPVALSIDSESDAFVNYESGILRYTCANAQPNHAVLLVGYGTDAATGKNFWLVKNTWGTKWGEQGYFRLEQTSSWNACYIYNKTVSLA